MENNTPQPWTWLGMIYCVMSYRTNHSKGESETEKSNCQAMYRLSWMVSMERPGAPGDPYEHAGWADPYNSEEAQKVVYVHRWMATSHSSVHNQLHSLLGLVCRTRGNRASAGGVF